MFLYCLFKRIFFFINYFTISEYTFPHMKLVSNEQNYCYFGIFFCNIWKPFFVQSETTNPKAFLYSFLIWVLSLSLSPSLSTAYY